MKQQVNLYRPIFRKQEKKFSALAMLQAGAAIFVGVAIIYALLYWHVHGLRHELAQTERYLAASSKRLHDVSRQLAPSAKSQLLEQEVARLERQVAGRLRVQDLLARGLFSNTTGYSEFFVAFARQHVSGVWLTGFDITGAGEDMRLQGRATDPAQVPRYVQRLSAEPALAGKEFKVFVLSRPEKTGGAANEPYVEFLFKTGASKEGRS